MVRQEAEEKEIIVIHLCSQQSELFEFIEFIEEMHTWWACGDF